MRPRLGIDLSRGHHGWAVVGEGKVCSGSWWAGRWGHSSASKNSSQTNQHLSCQRIYLLKFLLFLQWKKRHFMSGYILKPCFIILQYTEKQQRTFT